MEFTRTTAPFPSKHAWGWRITKFSGGVEVTTYEYARTKRGVYKKYLNHIDSQ